MQWLNNIRRRAKCEKNSDIIQALQRGGVIEITTPLQHIDIIIWSDMIFIKACTTSNSVTLYKVPFSLTRGLKLLMILDKSYFFHIFTNRGLWEQLRKWHFYTISYVTVLTRIYKKNTHKLNIFIIHTNNYKYPSQFLALS